MSGLWLGLWLLLQAQTVKIGVVAPLSSDLRGDAEALIKGVQLAVQQAQDLPVRVEVVVEDDRADPRAAVRAAERLAQDPAVIAVVGHYNSSTTLAAAPVYNREKLVAISPSATSPVITQAGPYLYRVVPSDAFQGQALARFAVEDLGARRIAIIHDDDDYGKGLAFFFAREARRKGAEIAGKFPVTPEEIGPSVRAALRAEPDLVFVACVYATAALVCRLLKGAGFTGHILGGDGLISDMFLKEAGKAAEGVYHTLYADPGSWRLQRFRELFQKTYGNPPILWAAFAYDAAGLILAAIREGRTTREGVKAYLDLLGKKLPPYPGVTGDIAFNESGDVLRGILIARIRNGKRVLVK